MIRYIQSVIVMLCLSNAVPTSGQSVMALRAFCSKPNAVSIVGGAHSRLVNEGARVTLTCCMPGVSNGHDHEQLVWIGPKGTELANHFSVPHSRADHLAYSVPDFRSPNHLVRVMWSLTLGERIHSLQTFRMLQSHKSFYGNCYLYYAIYLITFQEEQKLFFD